MDFKNPAKELFKSHPNTDEFHFTSDGQAFFLPTDAKAHARSLKDQNVTPVTRQEVEGKGSTAGTTQGIEKVESGTGEKTTNGRTTKE